MAGKIISAPKSILLTFFRLSCGLDLTCVRSVLQWIFLDAFLGGTSESPARPARYSSVLKLDRARHVLDSTKIRSGLRRTQERNRAPCHRRHSPRYWGSTHRRNPASHPYVKKTRLPHATDLCQM